MKNFKNKKLKEEKKVKKFHFFRFLINLFLIFSVAGIFTTIFLFSKYSKEIPSPDKLIERKQAETTKIYDRTGENLLYEIHGDEKRTIIELDEISDYIIQATISAEDKDFYNHQGFSLTGMARALFRDVYLYIQGKNLQGGSTLTQQLVKNTILTKEQKISRKIKEFILAYQIEQKFSKDEIIKMYLNEIPYGAVIYGVESASESFFGKSAKDLNIAESALLASLPKGPTLYSPYGNNTDLLVRRWEYIIDLMEENGYINKKEAIEAKNTDILSKIQIKTNNIKAPHFVMYVKELLAQEYGETEIEQGGYKIITTLDLELQEKAEEIIKNNRERIESRGGSNAGLISMNPKNGEVLAMVGSMDFFDNKNEGQFNVTLSQRQLGSSFKPIVYGAAFEKGYTPDTVVFDVETNFANSGEEYIPKNYAYKEYGPVSLKKALAGSLNIPAVKVLYLTGIENALNFAENFGYTTIKSEDKDKYGLSLVLGTAEASLLEHVRAYTTYANDGILTKEKLILKVINNKEETIAENNEIESARIIDREVARKVNFCISDNNERSFAFGYNNYLTLGDIPSAAKTGTTNDFKDAWTIGYTPEIITGVWVGNNDNKEMSEAPASEIAAPIWNEFMKFAVKDLPKTNFIDPIYTTQENKMLNGNYINYKEIEIDKITEKLATKETPEDLIKEVKYLDIHSILHYIDKNDLTKKIIENPKNDPQYDNWEKAIDDWIKEIIEKEDKTEYEKTIISNLIESQDEDIEIKTDEPPEEYDDVHSKDAVTNVNIKNLNNNSIFNNYIVPINIDFSVKGVFKKIQYIIDDIVVYETKIPKKEILLELLNINQGQHILTVKVFDEYLNRDSDSITFTMNANEDKIEWKNSSYNEINTWNNLELNLFIQNINNISNIKFYYQNSGNPKKLLSLLTDIKENNLKVNFQPTNSGYYKINAKIQKNSGEIITTETLNIRVN
ncbi:transglycosylase domain-containing protein [Patescibacteria group bacterium]|nr:transglycosylase domain-containing protein [Patescibacteria group bacterium]